jgi:hypothetical protein
MAQLSSMRLIWLLWVESRLKECLNKVVCVLKNKREEEEERGLGDPLQPLLTLRN